MDRGGLPSAVCRLPSAVCRLADTLTGPDAGAARLPRGPKTEDCGLKNLPPLHRDPIDRLLVAQATSEGVTLVTRDGQVSAYPGPIRRV